MDGMRDGSATAEAAQQSLADYAPAEEDVRLHGLKAWPSSTVKNSPPQIYTGKLLALAHTAHIDLRSFM